MKDSEELTFWFKLASGIIDMQPHAIHPMTDPPIEPDLPIEPDPPIEPIDLLDTDYADILANSKIPEWELRLVKWGTDPEEARALIGFIALVRERTDTPESWAAITEAWEANGGFEPHIERFQQLIKILWVHYQKNW